MKYRVLITAIAERYHNGAALGLHMVVKEFDTLAEAEQAVLMIENAGRTTGVQYEAVRLY